MQWKVVDRQTPQLSGGHPPSRRTIRICSGLVTCNNVSITGLSWLHSPSWSFALFACSRVVIDGIYIYTSLKEAVWADGIDIVSSHDISISNSTIATGDDCIAIVCGIPEWGPDYPTENITITNCRLSSASAAIKFTEGNSRLVQHVASATAPSSTAIAASRCALPPAAPFATS